MTSNVIRKFIFSFGGLLLCSMLFAQGKRPAWTQKAPKDTNAYHGIVQVIKPTPMDTIPLDPNYKENAIKNAMLKVAALIPWEVDEKASLLAKLSGEGRYKVSLEDVLYKSMVESPLFKLQVWENETEYWCYYTITKKDVELFLNQLLEQTAFSAQSIYEEALTLHKEGYIYRAALKYVEALDSLHPIIFRSMPVANDTGYVDLGHLIYDSYLNVYQGIAINTEVKAIPAIRGEGVPGTYAVKVTQNGVPLRKLGIVTTFEGVASADPTTDDAGNCWFHIDNVTSKVPVQHIGFSIDTEYLMDLPLIYGDNPLEGRNLFPSLKIPVNLFNPRTYTKFNTEASDSSLYKSLENIWKLNRNDAMITERFDSADVVVETSINIVKEQEIPTNKYLFVQYNAGMRLVVKSVDDDNVLCEYVIKDFKITLPSTRTEAQVRQSALREMTRQMNRELPKKVEEFNFNKREKVWKQLSAISK